MIQWVDGEVSMYVDESVGGWGSEYVRDTQVSQWVSLGESMGGSVVSL